MPWFRVCDTFAFNDKTVAAGNAAIGLWVRAGSWSAQNLTDGLVPKHMVTALGGTTAQARKLVDVGLWETTDDGYRFIDWDDAQPTRQEVQQDRAAARDRMRRTRSASRRSPRTRPDHREEVRPNNTEPNDRAKPSHDTNSNQEAAGTADETTMPPSEPASPRVRALCAVDVRPNSSRTSQPVRSTLTRPSPTSSPSPPPAAPTDKHHGGGGPTRVDELMGIADSIGKRAGVEVAAVIEALGPHWRIGQRAVERLTPGIHSALDAGWTKDDLANHLRASPEGVRSPFAVLSARLADLPRPPAVHSGLSLWCGQCDEATRMRETEDHRPYRCPACHPARLGNDARRRTGAA
ncbi:hypothetical protein SAMN05421678_106260 [Actinopolymorpha cephalotaxi]|uniref:Uncharacterized protein n=1 Tax=Actinopolymorpha cephalotaxi TaxID=504797 RepID=A0A1I2SL83_9ACTN|nr:hypothetical protein [Actinopolymorpha cephalotaxi]NYH84009.1 hypothetical protein [Actinopolymorpha cephalotaxi]SFG53273.1 hypothetical protein SAMN05421678_106260 [Actinopolymorpha cephalotaxi]